MSQFDVLFDVGPALTGDDDVSTWLEGAFLFPGAVAVARAAGLPIEFSAASALARGVVVPVEFTGGVLRVGRLPVEWLASPILLTPLPVDWTGAADRVTVLPVAVAGSLARAATLPVEFVGMLGGTRDARVVVEWSGAATRVWVLPVAWGGLTPAIPNAVVLDDVVFPTDPIPYRPFEWPRRYAKREAIGGGLTIQDFGATIVDEDVLLASGPTQVLAEPTVRALHERFRSRATGYRLTDWMGNDYMVRVEAFVPVPVKKGWNVKAATTTQVGGGSGAGGGGAFGWLYPGQYALGGGGSGKAVAGEPISFYGYTMTLHVLAATKFLGAAL